MATTTTVFTPTPSQLAFTSPYNVIDQWQTIIPRSEMVFAIIDGAIPVEAGGKDQAISVNLDLPAGQGYVLQELSMALVGVDAVDWDAVAHCELRDNATVANAAWVIPIELTNPGIAHEQTATVSRAYQMGRGVSKVFVPTKGENARMRITCMNLTVDGTLMTLTLYSRFLVFELNQALFWGVNTPVPVR